jgi:hypothetical protein
VIPDVQSSEHDPRPLDSKDVLADFSRERPIILVVALVA